MSDEKKQERTQPPPLQTWLQSGNYLPPPLRDFHDQKEVFKSIWQRLLRRFSADPSTEQYLGGMTWAQDQIFVIDHFLWFMAAHGWTLQRSRAKVDSYENLDATIKERRDREASVLLGGTQS